MKNDFLFETLKLLSTYFFTFIILKIPYLNGLSKNPDLYGFSILFIATLIYLIIKYFTSVIWPIRLNVSIISNDNPEPRETHLTDDQKYNENLLQLNIETKIFNTISKWIIGKLLHKNIIRLKIASSDGSITVRSSNYNDFEILTPPENGMSFQLNNTIIQIISAKDYKTQNIIEYDFYLRKLPLKDDQNKVISNIRCSLNVENPSFIIQMIMRSLIKIKEEPHKVLYYKRRNSDGE
ncbi:hypothetical protein EVU91_13080 [Macrococcoides bohemicum]|uniref:hypothetical protein n=1 Tax=Macrococcoides bohemicum TaxID=1903056 RepID=UPI001059D2FC|nr:hypothetical protein [Macrococcus bohemicus]TDL33509.1 hypothetical protein EVU91_13080 [Macrococcus bohemicus]